MVVFPNSKINLGLRIIRKRDDGYHELETVFYPIGLYDVLEVISESNSRQPAVENVLPHQRGNIDATYSGIEVEHRGENLCTRAIQLLSVDFPRLPSLKMHLHKAIPVGAGLGGGSADAAFTLKLINTQFNLGLTTDQLLGYASKLGSDCAFFIINSTSYATGRGEILEPVAPDLSNYKFAIINPGIHISTSLAFQDINPGMPARSVREIIQQPISTWRHELINDFESNIFPVYPVVEQLKKQLYEKGAVYASMSGTGSTVYGIFEKTLPVDLEIPSDYYYKMLAD